MEKIMKKIITTILLSGFLVIINPDMDQSVVNATSMAETAEEILDVEGLGKITTDTLNVRSGPGTDFSALGKVYSTDTVRIIGQLEDWYKIVYDDTEGYVSAEYVEVISLDVIEDETTVEEESSIDEPVIEETSKGKSPLLLVVIIAIIVVCIMLIGTIIALKMQSDDDEEEDADDDDEYDDDEYDDEYDDDVDDEYDEDDEEYDEVKYVEPENTDTEDYRIHIDPDFFDHIRNN